MKATCRSHCSSCGLHFSSTAAFDLHRIGPMDDRRCDHPLDAEPRPDGSPKFAALSDDGRCDVYGRREGFGVQHGVMVWTTGDLDKRRSTLCGLNAEPLTASDDDCEGLAA